MFEAMSAAAAEPQGAADSRGAATTPNEEVVDVVFDLAATALSEDHAGELLRQVLRFLPWLETEPGAGIHPLHGAPTTYGVLLLPRRTKLSLRLPRRRAVDALALTGRTLQIVDTMARVGDGQVRALTAHAAVYSALVVTGEENESAFLEAVGSELAGLGLRAEPVCGKRRRLRVAGRETVGFSLLLHELAPEASLTIQRTGIGAHRALGCGIFVPHRLAAAVFTR